MLLGWSLEASSSPSVAAKVGGGLAKLDGVWRLCPDFPLNVCRQLVSDMEAIPREKPPAAGARPAAQQQQQQPPMSLQRLCRFVHCWLGLTQVRVRVRVRVTLTLNLTLILTLTLTLTLSRQATTLALTIK